MDGAVFCYNQGMENEFKPNSSETSPDKGEISGDAEHPEKVEQISRREFFNKFRGESTEENGELNKLREQLKPKVENHFAAPAGVGGVGPKPKTYSRRKMLGWPLGIMAAATLTYLKWDKLAQWKRQWERKEVPAGLAGVIERIKDLYANVDQDADPTDWARAIEKSFQEADIPMNSENLGIVLTLIAAESGFREVPRVYDYSPLISEDELRKTDHAPRTGGPMELSYQHVQDRENISYDEAVKIVNSMEGGLKYGLLHLKDIMEAYESELDPTLKRSYIFADWNAGVYHSRNAGLQDQINRLSGTNLELDGILGEQSVKAIATLVAEQGVAELQVAEDLSHAKSSEFTETKTWQAIENLAGKPITPIVAKVKVLGWYGDLKKATTGVGDSKEFSKMRMKEFEEIRQVMEVK